ncbi:MAG: hypothetical protein KDK70_14390, partial [Myxococcales bacterium]|nr:hypothetical protein [Myxococcales bacterium]
AVVRGDDDDPVIDRDLLERLPAAFERLRHDGVKRDPQCRGKVAIAKALRRVDASAEEVFLVGVRTVQQEPVWGGRVDTAAELRGVCAMALMEARHPRAPVEVAHLLADPEIAARSAAARALGASGWADVAEPLLRLRLEAGEPEPAVVGECLGALLQVAPGESLPYVAGYLRSSDHAVAEAAALSLGESRLDGALEPLCAEAGRLVSSDGRHAVVMLAIAMLRSDAAWGWLLERVEQGGRGQALAALRALATFRHDPRLLARVSEAVARRTEEPIETTFEELFG